MWVLDQQDDFLYDLVDPEGRVIVHDIELHEAEYLIATRGERQYVVVGLDGYEDTRHI